MAEDALDHWYFRDSLQLDRVQFVGGIFIGLGANGRLATSVDGRTWVLRNTGTTARLSGVAYGTVLAGPGSPGNLFIAVGSDATILSSPDGTNWTKVVTTNTCSLNDVAWNGTRFVAAATRCNTSQPNALWSYDGVNWQPTTFPGGTSSYDCYAASRIVAVGTAFIVATGPCCAYDIWRISASFTSWTKVGFSEQVVAGLVNSGDRLLLVGWGGWPMSSTNLGTSWFAVGDTNVCSPSPGQFCMAGGDVAYGNATFVIARSWIRDGLLTTTDCSTWKMRPALKGFSVNSVAFGNGTFVAVGEEGIFQSEAVAAPILSASRVAESNALQLVISGEVGRSYRLQTSALSTAWSDRWVYTNNSGSVVFIDPITPEASRLFYRVVSP
ncbi:MAG TPA: hypothetical protein VI136_18800 [Verrucomicrobiae bacterium]